MERLQKILSAHGVTSRRAAEELIKQGRVRVNGRVSTLGDCADVTTDTIEIDGKALPTAPKHVYIMLNKPRGYITTLSDERGRKTAAQLIDCGTRVYPIGRLDCDSEGLLLFTNDGALAQKLMHPHGGAGKVYEVTAIGQLDGAEERLRKPIVLDGYRIRPPQVRLLHEEDSGAVFEITIFEGRNRQVRRMFEAAGLRVKRLRRVREGALSLGTLPSGSWRYLSKEEIAQICKF
ncbi:MAG: rRNA pseudouridine synthase [Oscillospiraceae bacterium]|jgi:23S rRNA pseudouridine2605 synthase|nr:rRNA pseudouridine synthase [Oscillospiraceae bacterium]